MKITDKLKPISKSKEKDFVNRLKKIEWIYWLNRPYSVFMGTILWAGVRKQFFERTGFKGLESNNNLYQHPDLYFDKKFQDKGLVYFKKHFKSHKMSEISESLGKLHDHHISQLKEITASNNKKIPEKIAIMADLVRDYIPYIWATIQLEKYFDEVVVKEVPKYIKGDYSKFVGDISVPDKKNSYGLMIDEIKSGISIDRVQKKYGWMKSRDGFTDFYTEEEILEIKNGIKESEKHSVDIPKELGWLSEELKELTFFRTDRTDKFYEYWGVARPLLEQIADYVGVSFKELADYDAMSIISGEPKKYNKSFSYGLIGDRYFVSNDKFIDFSENLSSEIKGKIAFKGIVRGTVKIVTHPNDISKVNQGDILVAQMTLPSFISAMQKAVAFVTDEGSITCHAAIMAREMKKPCIVGTRNATKILKDGDMVEVDADKGIVKILK